MTIYQSTRVMPYVYLLVHRETGQFYYGSRYTKELKLPSHIDLPKYKSSSKFVKELGFENFDYFIIAEFFDGQDAWDYEQRQIKLHWGNPLLLNKQFVDVDDEKHRFVKPKERSKEYRENLSKQRKGKPKSAETKAKISAGLTGNKQTTETKAKRAASKSRDWIVTFPNGSTAQITNMVDFCRNHGLNHGHMFQVAKGNLKQHKGFTATAV